MASPHLSAQVISRGNGHSAVEASAYRTRSVLTDERTGQTHDYTRARSGCIFEGIYAPKGAPEWAHDRAQLWNHVEAFEKHQRAELAQEINIALPHELTLQQNRYLLQDWVKENATRKGLIADVAIHEPDRRGDERNIHAHVMIVRRKLDGTEFVRTKDRFDKFSEKQAAKEADLMAMRQSWEKLANRHLERHGLEARIDMGRAQDREPTKHLGKAASRMEREGRASEIGDHNRAAAAANSRQPANENDRERQLWVELKQAEAEASTLAELVKQQQERDRTTQIAHDQVQAENTPQHREAQPEFDRQEQKAAQAVRDEQRAQEQRQRGDGTTASRARNAMEDIARVDPLGAVRMFGFHAGDHLKTPQEAVQDYARMMRGGVSAERAAENTAAWEQIAERPQDLARDLHIRETAPEASREAEADRTRERTPEPKTRTQPMENERGGLFQKIRDFVRGWWEPTPQPVPQIDRAADRQQDHDAGSDRKAEHVRQTPAKEHAPEPAQQQAEPARQPAPEREHPRPAQRLVRDVADVWLAEARAELARERAAETPQQRAERERGGAEQSRGRGDGSRERERHRHSLLWELLHPFQDHRRRDHHHEGPRP